MEASITTTTVDDGSRSTIAREVVRPARNPRRSLLAFAFAAGLLVLHVVLFSSYSFSKGSSSSLSARGPVDPVPSGATAAASGGMEWDYQYMDTIPSPDQEWPVRRSNSRRMTTCIPAVYGDAETRLPAVLKSVAAQTTPTDEVIIAMSEVPKGGDDGTNPCLVIHEKLRKELEEAGGKQTNIPLRLLCIGEKGVTPGRKRNVAGKLAGGNILSFVGPNHVEDPQRNAVIHNLFACHDGIKMVLHSCPGDKEDAAAHPPPKDRTCVDDEEGLKVFRGPQLYDMLETTHKRQFLDPSICNAHLVLHRTVLERVFFSSIYEGEQNLMVRDVLYAYGRNDRSAIFIDRSLTSNP